MPFSTSPLIAKLSPCGIPLELDELLDEELLDELLELEDELLDDGVGVGLFPPQAAKVLASNTKQP